MGKNKSQPKKANERIDLFKVEIMNIRVGKKFYSFNYNLRRNQVLVEQGVYSSSHSRSPNSIRKWLKEGWGAELVLGMIYG